MPFVMLYTPNKSAPRDEHVPRTMAKVQEMTAAGQILITGGLANRETGAARITLASGACSVERSPAGDSVLFGADGFAVMEANGIDEAIELGQSFIIAAGDGTIEVAEFFLPPAGR